MALQEYIMINHIEGSRLVQHHQGHSGALVQG